MKMFDLAMKDLKLLLRDKLAAFFIIGFPILMGLFFGLVMGGNSSSSDDGGKMQVAFVDQDHTPFSEKFRESLAQNQSINLVTDTLESATESVRKGTRTGVIVLPQGFGEKAGIMWETQPEIQVGTDPSRAAESAMLEGFIMQANASLIGERFKDPQQFLPSIATAKQEFLGNADAPLRLIGEAFFGSLEKMIDTADQFQTQGETDGLGGAEIQFVNIKRIDVTRKIEPNAIRDQLTKIRSRWDISFPQAMLWGVLGCVAGFSISIARERTMGTMLRLQVSPLSKLQILLGKATACFLAVLFVMIVMVSLGLLLKMQPASFSKLAVAAIATGVCFVGIMMTFAVLGKSEASVSGIGWALNTVMAMIGGCMIPAMFLPGFLQKLSFISPVRWSILAIEGAIWRDFSWQEMLFPCFVLVAIGAVGFTVGTSILYRRTN